MVRRLSPEEYEQLPEPRPDAHNSIVGVIFQNGHIVGRNYLVTPLHVEGTWIIPEYRGGSMLKRLMDWAEQESKKLGVNRLFVYGTEDTEDYLRRLGYVKQPYTVFTKEL